MESISQKQNIQLVYNKRLVSNICFATENMQEAEKATDSSFKKILWNNNNNNNKRDNDRHERVTEMQQRRRHQKSGETRAHTQRAQNRAGLARRSLAAAAKHAKKTRTTKGARKQEKRHIPTSKWALQTSNLTLWY